MNGSAVFRESNVVVHLHFVEQPIRIALKNLCEMNADIPSWLAESIHDSAQGRFVNAQHSCQAVLPDARGVHPQLQVRINVSIQGHSFALISCLASAHLWGAEEAANADSTAISVPNCESLIRQHIVALGIEMNSQKVATLPELSEVMFEVTVEK